MQEKRVCEVEPELILMENAATWLEEKERREKEAEKTKEIGKFYRSRLCDKAHIVKYSKQPTKRHKKENSPSPGFITRTIMIKGGQQMSPNFKGTLRALRKSGRYDKVIAKKYVKDLMFCIDTIKNWTEGKITAMLIKTHYEATKHPVIRSNNNPNHISALMGDLRGLIDYGMVVCDGFTFNFSEYFANAATADIAAVASETRKHQRKIKSAKKHKIPINWKIPIPYLHEMYGKYDTAPPPPDDIPETENKTVDKIKTPDKTKTPDKESIQIDLDGKVIISVNMLAELATRLPRGSSIIYESPDNSRLIINI